MGNGASDDVPGTGLVAVKRKKTGGRKKGSANKLGHAAREYLSTHSDYLSTLCKLAKGRPIRLSRQRGHKPEWVRPTLNDMKWALEIIINRLIPTVAQAEISGPDGEAITITAGEPNMRETARRLALIFQRADPANDLAEAEEARDGPAVASAAATQQASAFSSAFHAPSMPPDDPTSPPFSWFVQPDGGGFIVTHMGEQRAQCATETEAIKAAWAMARGLPEPVDEVVPEPKDDDKPKELEAPAIDCRLVFHEVEGMSIACQAPIRPGLPNMFSVLDGRGLLVRTGNFASLVEFLERRHGGPLPKPDLRSDESYRGPEPSRPDERESAPPPPVVTRSYEHRKAFLKS